MSAPTNAVIDKIKLAEEAVSFAILARGFFVGDTKSTTASIAVFINSDAITAPIIPIQNNHSYTDIEK